MIISLLRFFMSYYVCLLTLTSEQITSLKVAVFISAIFWGFSWTTRESFFSGERGRGKGNVLSIKDQFAISTEAG